MPYLDSEGIPTVGIGRNLKSIGLSVIEVYKVLETFEINLEETDLDQFLAEGTAVYDGFNLKFNELFPYQSITGNNALTDELMQELLFSDLAVANQGAIRVLGDAYHELPDYVQEVVIQLVFNLGVGTFSKFKKAIAAFKAGDFAEAADEILDSRAARQTGQRYHRFAQVLRTGDRKEYLV